ncbi:hypothetical protein VFPBJ_04836 [Purpureocillium lilacinum]|uniref:Secreted protein n=1 Tax=Purpureocillium lilacinum TaxID=33203 RepID=A0A179GWV4_PURLI|nr:hypothetical protein VFPBJ_04836 [Purpureocillium lilacinum]
MKSSLAVLVTLCAGAAYGETFLGVSPPSLISLPYAAPNTHKAEHQLKQHEPKHTLTTVALPERVHPLCCPKLLTIPPFLQNALDVPREKVPRPPLDDTHRLDRQGIPGQTGVSDHGLLRAHKGKSTRETRQANKRKKQSDEIHRVSRAINE